jgi:phage terminase large subunit-like protein
LGKITEYDKLNNPSLIIGDDKLWVDPRDKESKYFDNAWYQAWYEREFTARGLKSEGEGQLLWADYLGEKETQSDESHLGSYGTSSQMQQRPIKRGGNFFNSECFEIVPLSAVDLNELIYIRYWDKSGTKGKGDWTVGTLIGRTKKRPYVFYLIDMKRFQVAYFERMKIMRDTALEDYRNYVEHRDNTAYTIGIEQEGGSAGKDLTYIEKHEALSEFDVWIDRKSGQRKTSSKESRGKILQQRAEGGFVKVVLNSVWNPIFFKRLEKYEPSKATNKDDEVDSVSGGVYYLGYINLTKQHYSSSRAM